MSRMAYSIRAISRRAELPGYASAGLSAPASASVGFLRHPRTPPSPDPVRSIPAERRSRRIGGTIPPIKSHTRCETTRRGPRDHDTSSHIQQQEQPTFCDTPQAFPRSRLPTPRSSDQGTFASRHPEAVGSKAARSLSLSARPFDCKRPSSSPGQESDTRGFRVGPGRTRMMLQARRPVVFGDDRELARSFAHDPPTGLPSLPSRHGEITFPQGPRARWQGSCSTPP